MRRRKERELMAVNRSPLHVRILKNWQIYLFLLPALLYLAIFAYGPMGGLYMAFTDYRPATGIYGGEWVGLKHFIRLFGLRKFSRVFMNTVTISLYSFALFPLNIIFALLLHTCPFMRFKKAVQTITYAPHFISTVIIVSMVNLFFSPTMGIVGNTLRALGLLEGPFKILQKGESFIHLYIWSGVWQGIGWGSIIYLSALSGIDPALHESAVIDGANRLQRIWHIDLPGIMPTVMVLLIMRCGRLLGVGFEKAWLMQNSFNSRHAEVLSTYVYALGFNDGQWSFSTAVGLFNTLINFVLLITVNTISRHVSENSLW